MWIALEKVGYKDEARHGVVTGRTHQAQRKGAIFRVEET